MATSWSLRPDIRRRQDDEEEITNLKQPSNHHDDYYSDSYYGDDEVVDSTRTIELLQDELEEATERHKQQQQQQQQQRSKALGGDRWCNKYYIIAGLAAFVLLFALKGAVTDRKPNHEHYPHHYSYPHSGGTGSSSATTTTTTTTTNVPKEHDGRPTFLPTFTWHTILEEEEDGNSPQAKSFYWVQEHPQFLLEQQEKMPIWRIQQLMALGTLLFARDGDNGVPQITTNYEDECQWKFKSLRVECNDEGKIVTVEVFFQSSTTTTTWNLPPELSMLSLLSKLEIHNQDNSLTGTIPTQIGLLSSLTKLSLFKNSLEGELPAQLGQLTKLEILMISHTNIGGTLPQYWSSSTNLVNLKEVHLSFNQLRGTIPLQWISNLAEGGQLTTLKLSKNFLTGSLPTTLGLLTSLTDLSLQSNQLTGPIIPPAVVGTTTTSDGGGDGMKHLRVLQLFDNRFDGTIPSVELSKMTKLEAIFLHNNQLTGSISINPSSSSAEEEEEEEDVFWWQEMTMLESLKLQQNKDLTGSIPKEVCNDLVRLTQIVVDCNDSDRDISESGGITCACPQCICG